MKRKITAYLKTVEGLWYDMPVPAGYGKSTLDYLGCYRGRFFAIEAKRPGGVPTPRQELTMDNMIAAGGVVFTISGDSDLTLLKQWIASLQE